MNIEALSLLSNTLTPLTVAIVGYFINKNLSKNTQKIVESNILIEKRMALYDEMAQPLNNIYCFINDVGSYKELMPELIIKDKRVCDRLFHIYRPIWDKNVIDAYKEFMSSSFATFGRSGDDAKIRTVMVEKIKTANWDDAWNEELTGERDFKYHKKYVDLLNSIADNLRLSAR